MKNEATIEEIDADPILSALYGALNLQAGIAYYCDAVPGLDGDYHFNKIREAIKFREKELAFAR